MSKLLRPLTSMSMFPRTTRRLQIDTHLLIWSGVDEPLQIFKPRNVYEVKISITKDPNNVVLIPLKRRNLLKQLENELLETRAIPWKTAKPDTTFLEIKLNDFFGYWWNEEKKIVRVKIMESQEQLSILQLSGANKGQAIGIGVFLIDYGIKKHVLLENLSLLEARHCRFPPLAVSSTIIAPKALSPECPRASFYQQSLHETSRKVRVEDLTFDSFGIPHAKVKVLDFDVPLMIQPEPQFVKPSQQKESSKNSERDWNY